MKVTVKCEEEKVEYSFPMLMEAVGTGFIVLFTSETVGVVINKGSSVLWAVGEYCDEWLTCDDKNHWKKFTGTITLEND